MKQSSGYRVQGSENSRVSGIRVFLEYWNLLPAGLILLAAAVATAPLIWNGFSCGHDFDFHFVSWMDTLQAWRNGLFYPLWTPSANYGSGEPRLIFYPPITWMLGALSGWLFGWLAAPVVLTFLLLAATGLGTRALAKQFLTEGASTLAGCLAIFSGYALYCVYERAAYGELAGGCMIPLVLLFALKALPLPQMEQSTPARNRLSWSLPLAFTIAASWLANVPVGIMACYLLAAFCLVLAIMHRSWQLILRATVSVVLGLCLAAFYIVPAAAEQKWIDAQELVNDPGLAIENSFLFAHHASPLLRDHDIELQKTSAIAAIMLAITASAILLCWLRKTLPGERRLWLPLALIPLGILLLQLPASLPVWNLLPKLRFLQFPWRWLVALEAPLGIFVAAAVWPRASVSGARIVRIAVGVVSAAVFAYVAAFAGTRFHQTCDDEDSIPAMVATWDARTGFTGTDEYAPPHADDTLVATNLPGGCLVSDPDTQLGKGDPDNPPPNWSADQKSCDADYPFAVQTLEHRSVQSTAPHAGWLILRLRRYPAWIVRVNGHLVSNFPLRDDGLFVVPVPAGKFSVTADWASLPDILIGRAITFGALLAVVVLLYLQLRRRKA